MATARGEVAGDKENLVSGSQRTAWGVQTLGGHRWAITSIRMIFSWIRLRQRSAGMPNAAPQLPLRDRSSFARGPVLSEVKALRFS